PRRSARSTATRNRTEATMELACCGRPRGPRAGARSPPRNARRAARAGSCRLRAAATAASGSVTLLVLLARTAPSPIVTAQLLVLAALRWRGRRRRAAAAGLAPEGSGDPRCAGLRLVLVREPAVPDGRSLLHRPELLLGTLGLELRVVQQREHLLADLGI